MHFPHPGVLRPDCTVEVPQVDEKYKFLSHISRDSGLIGPGVEPRNLFLSVLWGDWGGGMGGVVLRVNYARQQAETGPSSVLWDNLWLVTDAC